MLTYHANFCPYMAEILPKLRKTLYNQSIMLMFSFNKAAGSLPSGHFYLYSYRRILTHNQVCGTLNIQRFLIVYGTVFVLKFQCLLGEGTKTYNFP